MRRDLKPKGRRSVPTPSQARRQHERDRQDARAIAERARQAEAAERAELDAEIDELLRANRAAAMGGDDHAA